MDKKTGRQTFISKWTTRYEVIPLITIFIVNLIVFSGTGVLTASWHHYDLTTAFDRAVPFWPVFIWPYLLAYFFWAACYILAAQNGKDWFYRMVATDLMVHLVCMFFFLVMPTTNVRPEITGNSISEKALGLIYWIDGGDLPGNLFPSIHCYVSWLSYRIVREVKTLPRWASPAAFVCAVMIIVSTQVLKQHYIADAVAGVLLVEIFWRVFMKGSRHMPFYRFFEKINQKVWKDKLD